MVARDTIVVNVVDIPFFIFGAGNRTKLIYRSGKLIDWPTNRVVLQCDPAEETINAAACCVTIVTKQGHQIRIVEDDHGVRLEREGVQEVLTRSPVNLPTFAGRPYQNLLRILHHEILINIVGARPVPNFMVYPKPWCRDAAMMAMVLGRTGNIDLIRQWIKDLREPFDLNNQGHQEPDNLGQVLYLISLVSDASHPVVPCILDEVGRFRKDRHIVGLTDSAEHPVYQTRWLKYGLRSLGLPDPYVAPDVEDSYADLIWWDVEDRSDVRNDSVKKNALYPYLTWAQAHCLGEPPPLDLLGKTFPLTWECRASMADYSGMGVVDDAYVEAKTCAPHTWHAAEAFLYLISQRDQC